MVSKWPHTGDLTATEADTNGGPRHERGGRRTNGKRTQLRRRPALARRAHEAALRSGHCARPQGDRAGEGRDVTQGQATRTGGRRGRRSRAPRRACARRPDGRSDSRPGRGRGRVARGADRRRLYGAIAGILALIGRNRVQAGSPPVPEETVESVKEDVEWTKASARQARR